MLIMVMEIKFPFFQLNIYFSRIPISFYFNFFTTH